jgi:hypothetical protein
MELSGEKLKLLSELEGKLILQATVMGTYLRLLKEALDD